MFSLKSLSIVTPLLARLIAGPKHGTGVHVPYIYGLVNY